MAGIFRYFDPANPSPKKPREKILLVGSKKFVDDTEKMMEGWIYYSYTGRAVLDIIYGSRAGLKLTVQEYTGAPFTATEDDPSTPEDERLDGWAVNAVADQIRKPDGSFATGTGKGASSIISFSHSVVPPASLCSGKACANLTFYKPRHVLFHEMIHSMRHMTGKWQTFTVNMGISVKEPTMMEEAIACLLANVQMSEKGESQLRETYTTSKLFTPDVDVYAKDKDSQIVIDKIRDDHLVLYNTIKDLKYISFTFNPFYARELVRNKTP